MVLYITICTIIIALTRALAYWGIYVLKDNPITLIKNVLNLTYVENTGAAFGMFSGNTLILGIVSIALIWYIVKEIRANINNKLELFSLSLVLSGAIGNLIDRLLRGFVVDFISFKLFGEQMPIFNVADIFVTIGVLLLILCIIWGEKNENNSKRRTNK